MTNKSLVCVLISLVLSACGGSGGNDLDDNTDFDVKADECDATSNIQNSGGDCIADNATTPPACGQDQDLEIVIPVPEPKYQTAVDSDEYELYLRQTIEVMAPATTLAGEDAVAKTFVDTQIDNFLEYQKSGSIVTGATNPLDFLEAIIDTTDPNQEVEAFKTAKQQVARGIADDDFCAYTNDDIRLVDTSADANTLAFAEVSISYNPFSKIVQQSTLITSVRDDLNTSEARANVPYVGFYQALPQNFKAVGYSEPEIRQAIINDTSGFAQLAFDQGADTKLGQILLTYNNEHCDDNRAGKEIANWADCPSGTATRAPSNEVGGVCDAEANKIKENSFDLNASNTGLKRLRVEVDYFDDADDATDAAAQVRFYASTYREAIYASDGTTIIEDPTDCEKQAVLDELAALTPGVGVRLILVPDPNYDIEYQTDTNGDAVLDFDGNQVILNEPTPTVVYQGTVSAIQP